MTTRDEFDVNRKTGSVMSNGAVMPNGVVVTNVYEAWNASRAESEKEIAELQAELKAMVNRATGYYHDIEKQDLTIAELQAQNQTQLDLIIKQDNNRAELQASNNRLREALIDTNSRFNEMVDVFYKGSTAGDRKRIEANFELLSSTPAQSLAEHDAELIERCAKVCDDKCLQLEKKAEEYSEAGEWDEVNNQRAIAWIVNVVATSIREMKGQV